MKLINAGRDIKEAAGRKATAISLQRDHDIKSVDDLPFISRDGGGQINWWDVTRPKTEYWNVHAALGRAYAYDLLDLLQNPIANLKGHEAGHILRAAAMGDPSIADGFFEVVGQHLTTGDVSR
jgi:hypothetical protein